MKNWWLNYWYHYKVRTLVCAFLAVIAAVSVWQFTSSEKYDYNVYMYLSQGITSEVRHSVATAVEIYADDVDGNGKVSVNIIDLSYNPYDTNGENKMAYASTLSVELNNCENFIFITDDYRFSELDEKGIYEKESFFYDENGKAMRLSKTAFEKEIKNNFEKAGLSAQKVPEMMICMKTNPGKSSKHYESYKRDLSLVENIAKKGK